MAEVKIVDVRRVPSIDPKRKGANDVLVLYQITGGPVLFLRVPDEGFSEATLREKIKADQDLRVKYQGKTFTL